MENMGIVYGDLLGRSLREICDDFFVDFFGILMGNSWGRSRWTNPTLRDGLCQWRFADCNWWESVHWLTDDMPWVYNMDQYDTYIICTNIRIYVHISNMSRYEVCVKMGYAGIHTFVSWHFFTVEPICEQICIPARFNSSHLTISVVFFFSTFCQRCYGYSIISQEGIAIDVGCILRISSSYVSTLW